MNETTTALVCKEDALPILGYSKERTMVLKDPYSKLRWIRWFCNIFVVSVSGFIGISKFYMLRPVSKWLTRFSEHGFMVALGSIAEHWESMNDMKVKSMMNHDVEESFIVINTMFEYWLLICGLSMGCLVFICEWFVGRNV